MDDDTVDAAPALPFTNLDDVLLPLLLGTGSRGADAIRKLLAIRAGGMAHHLGTRELRTPAGRLRINLFNKSSATFNRDRHHELTISLEMRPGMGCVHGEVYMLGHVLPATICLAAVGRPLSDLCETPASFPGRHAAIRRVRTLTSSTRILIDHEPATVTLDELDAAPRVRQDGPMLIHRRRA